MVAQHHLFNLIVVKKHGSNGKFLSETINSIEP